MINNDNKKNGKKDGLRHRSLADKDDADAKYGAVVIEQVKMKKEVGLVGGISLIVGTIIGNTNIKQS